MIVFHIKEIRIKKKLSQKQLAEMSGVSKSYLSELENDLKCPTILVLCKIADSLKVKVEDLYTYKNEKNF